MQNQVILVQQFIIFMLVGCLLYQRYHRQWRQWWQRRHAKPKRPRQLRPRSPRDCDACCMAHALGEAYAASLPSPWREVKSPRGRPKEYDSEGHACMHEGCPYYGITDQNIHALRRNGTRNQCEPTAQWECGYCGKSRTAWLGTVQYGLKTSSQTVSLALHLHMKGMTAADISEVLGISPTTIQRWLDRGGQHSLKLHQSRLKHLIAHHIQLDELVTKVRNRLKRAWVWTAIDVETKLMMAWEVGNRAQADAHRLGHQLFERLADHIMPAFTSDGLNFYYYMLTAHFGQWTVVAGKRKPVWNPAPDLLYGQLKKSRSRYKLKAISTRMRCGTRADMRQSLRGIGLSGKIQTAIVERLNLTLRHIVPALRRRTWGLAYSVQSLRLRVALGAAYYNFCRPHYSLKGWHAKRRVSPAMAAGLTDHVWTVREFILKPVY